MNYNPYRGINFEVYDMVKITELRSVSYAIMAALLYGVSPPVSKVLLLKLNPTLMAALLYLGAGFGMLLINLGQVVLKKEKKEAKMTQSELLYILGMIVLDIMAPIFLMMGIITFIQTFVNAGLFL